MTDCIIIGAGPAGLAAAISLREWDLDVVVLDEFMKPGGRLLGQLHQEPDGQWWNGLEEARRLVEQTEKLGVDIRLGQPVHHIEQADNGFHVYAGEEVLHAEQLLIATGAAEAPAPIPGWTLPGVMTIGAAQVMTNVHRVKVGEKGFIVGVNILSAAISRELQLAGIKVLGMALPVLSSATEREGNPRTVMQRLARLAHLAPSGLIRFASKWAEQAWAQNLALRFYPKKGISMWDIPVHLRKAVLRINGEKQVESITLADVTADGEIIPGTEKTLEVDFVCIAGGLYPLAELAAVIGCPFRYVEELGGHIPIHNEEMQTPIEGLFVAGNITGIENAKVAKAQGRLAGLAMAKQKHKTEEKLRGLLREAKEEVSLARKQATIQFHPGIEEGRKKIYEAFKEWEQTKK